MTWNDTLIPLLLFLMVVMHMADKLHFAYFMQGMLVVVLCYKVYCNLKRVLTIVRVGGGGGGGEDFVVPVVCDVSELKILYITCYTIKLLTNRSPLMSSVTSVCEK